MQVRLTLNLGRRDADAAGLDPAAAKSGTVHFLPEKVGMALIERAWAVLIPPDAPRRGRPPGRPSAKPEVRGIPRLDVLSTESTESIESIDESIESSEIGSE